MENVVEIEICPIFTLLNLNLFTGLRACDIVLASLEN